MQYDRAELAHVAVGIAGPDNGKVIAGHGVKIQLRGVLPGIVWIQVRRPARGHTTALEFAGDGDVSTHIVAAIGYRDAECASGIVSTDALFQGNSAGATLQGEQQDDDCRQLSLVKSLWLNIP